MSELRGIRTPADLIDPRDRAILLAEQLVQDDACPGCGQPMTYAMDSDSKRHWLVEKHRCYSCSAREESSKKAKSADPADLVWTSPDEALQYAMQHPLPPEPAD